MTSALAGPNDTSLARSVLNLDGRQIHAATWSTPHDSSVSDAPQPIVLLHDGLGSIDQWRAIPATLAATTGRTVFAYERPGHGKSTPVPAGPWPPDWLHTEAAHLVRVLDHLEVADPILVGHSDGGSIALLAVAEHGVAASGLVTLAAHSSVDPLCYDAIIAMRQNTLAIVAGLARSHAAPAEIFEAWSGVWVSDPFQEWDIAPLLGAIGCPTIIGQGDADEYAPPSHAAAIALAIGSNAECRLLPGLGHLLHHQDPEAVIALVAEFVATIE